MYPFNNMLPVPPPSTFLPRRRKCFESSPFHVKIVTGAGDCAGSFSISCRPALQQLLCYLRVPLLFSEFCITCLRREGGLVSIMGFIPCIGKGWNKSFGGVREMSCCCKLPVAGGYLLIHHSVPPQSSEVLRYGEPILRDGNIQLSTETPF